MKSLEEKKLLVKMAKMLGQPVDQALVESIEREEKLAEVFFGEKKKEGEDSEEERRLFYVAITRARKTLYLTLAQMRTIFGNKQINTKSIIVIIVLHAFIYQLLFDQL